MSTSDLPSDADDGLPKLPDSYRFALSKNQKRRSKLMQASEPDAPPPVEEPLPEPIVPPPAQIELPPQPRRARLKRSGHMHENLTAPVPDKPPPIETEY